MEVSVVLPCLNEEGLVGRCVEEAVASLTEEGISHEVVVGDNGSTDGSAREAERAGARVVTETRRGYGWACLAGISVSRGRFLLLADADGTYPLRDAPRFVERLREGEGALVLGSRFKGKILPGAMPALHRLIGNPGTRLLLRILFGVRCSDPHSGMRAMSRRTFEAIQPANRTFEYTIQMIMNATRLGVDIDEIPIVYEARMGRSKLRALPEGWSLLRFLLLNSPTFLYLVPGLAAMAAGAWGLAWLGSGDRTVGSATFSINTLVVAAVLTVAGFQVVTLGICARAYGLRELGPGLHPGLRRLRRLFSVERGLVVAIACIAIGLVLVVRVGSHWMSTEFGVVSKSDHRLVLLGLTAVILGFQCIFFSFFLSLFLTEEGGS